MGRRGVVVAVLGALLVGWIVGALSTANRGTTTVTVTAAARSTTTASAPGTTSTTTTTASTAVATTANANSRTPMTDFAGSLFSMSYPRTFALLAGESPNANVVTTIVASRSDPAVRIRVDFVPTTNTTPGALVFSNESHLSAEPGYRKLQLRATTFHGSYVAFPAIRWDFLVDEGGNTIRKDDTFFLDTSGDEVAILTQAPANVWARWASVFARVRSSFEDTGTSVFCGTHTCIDNFDNGSGYIVQCADGEWSHSGGESGACSYHGGETSNVYAGPP